MTKNVGAADKTIRLLSGALLIVLALFSGLTIFNNTALMVAAIVVGAVLIGTALFNFCPLYRVLGIRTCRV